MDDATLTRRLDAHRREILIHCYRMLGSAPDAEDATQDALLRAWQSRAGLEDPRTLRSWLYRIATNVCLDGIAKRGPRVLPHLAFPPAEQATPPRPFLEDAIWVGPFPSDDAAAASPDVAHERAEAVALAFVAALQHLPGKQRAALLLRDVVDLSANEAADVLDTTPTAVEAALKRARKTLAERSSPERREPPHATTTSQTPRSEPAGLTGSAVPASVGSLLERYVAAWHSRDPRAFMSLLAEDASFVMPPTPVWFQGRESVGRFVGDRLREHAWRLVPTRANGLPAFGLYRQVAEGDYVAHGIQVIELDEGAIELGHGAIERIHTFLALKNERLFQSFGLPARIEGLAAPAGATR